VTLDAAACGFGYRDSVFKQHRAGQGWPARASSPRALSAARPWQPVLGYLTWNARWPRRAFPHPTRDDRRLGVRDPPRQAARPGALGNAGSFFKNPVVTPEQCRDIIGRDPAVVHYPLPDGSCKLAAGWLIDACGWKGKTVGRAGVYEKQALVLVNRGGASGAEVVTLARAIQESVYGRFGIRLEPEPVIV
jgi:UDP-N-acetylmuramate dehydrogenase